VSVSVEARHGSFLVAAGRVNSLVH